MPKKGFKAINKEQVEAEAKARAEAEAQQAEKIINQAKSLCAVLQEKKIYNAQGLIQNLAVIIQQGFMMKMSSMKVDELGLIEILKRQIKPGSVMEGDQNLLLAMLEAIKSESISSVAQTAEWINKKITKEVEKLHAQDDFKNYDLFQPDVKPETKTA